MEFENFLLEQGIEIPNQERDVYEGRKGTEKAILFGLEYYTLEDKHKALVIKHF